MITCDLSLARTAFRNNDVELMRTAHGAANSSSSDTQNGRETCLTMTARAQLQTALDIQNAGELQSDGGGRVGVIEQGHNHRSGKFVKSIVYGGLDGIITTFSIVAGVTGSGLSYEVVIVLGFVCLIADGFSMAFGDYLSTQAEREYNKGERNREQWELDNYPEGEKEEMVQVYVNNGFSEADAKAVIGILSNNEQFFVDHMMVHELGLLPPDTHDDSHKKSGVTFFSFFAFGLVPLLAYLITNYLSGPSFAVSCVFTVLMLGILGGVKGKLTNSGSISQTMKVITNGVIGGSLAYILGFALGKLTGTC